MNEQSQLESYKTSYERMLSNSACSYGSIYLKLWEDYLNEREKDGNKRKSKHGHMLCQSDRR